MAVLLIEFISSLNIPELLVKSHLNVVSSLRCPGELSKEIKVSMPNCKGGNNIPPPSISLPFSQDNRNDD